MEKDRTHAQRERRYRTLYNISVDEYDRILEHQLGGCAICGRPPKNVRHAVDHAHKTGEVRGVLCMGCNRRLGEQITIEWLEAALEYLRNYPTQQALGYVPIGRTGRVTKRRRRR